MRIVSKVGILALCALAPLLMAPSGGFPSRPRFQAVSVGNNGAAATGQLRVSNTGADSVILIDSSTSGNAYTRYVNFGVANWAVGQERATGDLVFAPQATLVSPVARLTAAGALTVSGLNYASGPLWASARVLGAGTLSGGHNVASAVRNSTGSYTVTWTTSFASAPPVCTATTSGSINAIALITNHTPNNGNVAISVFNPATGGLIDPTGFHVVCTSGQ